MLPPALNWQSKVILLLVLPVSAVGVVLQARAAIPGASGDLAWTLGLSAFFGLIAWASRSGTLAAAGTGALLTAEMMLGAVVRPLQPWRSALIPVLTVLSLTSLATRFGRKRKEGLGTAEQKRGRGSAQVAANLGMGALLFNPVVQLWLMDSRVFAVVGIGRIAMFAPALAALAEAAADTVSSEVGQVLGGRPYMLTSFRQVEPGTDGAISLSGTAAGIVAAGAVAAAGAWALRGGGQMLGAAWAGGVFGLLFDSLLGATVERAGWLNNDAVNFVSTASAAGFALAMMTVMPHPGVG